MPSALEASSKANYSRSEWGSLSIQDRIRAMNQKLDAVNNASLVVETTPPEDPQPPQSNPPVLEPSSDSNNSLMSPSSPSFRKRSSVVDIWRQREAGGNLNVADKPDSMQNKSITKEGFEPPAIPKIRQTAEEEKKDDEENTKPSDTLEKPSRFSTPFDRRQSYHVDCSNETPTVHSVTISSTNAFPIARVSLPENLTILPSKPTETVKSHRSKVAERWTKRSLHESLETETKVEIPEKLQEPPVANIKTEQKMSSRSTAEPKRSRVLDMWMKRTEAGANFTSLPFESKDEAEKRSLNHPDSVARSVTSLAESNDQTIANSSKRSDTAAGSNDVAALSNGQTRAEKKERKDTSSNSNNFFSGKIDEARKRRANRTNAVSDSFLASNDGEARVDTTKRANTAATFYNASADVKNEPKSTQVKRTESRGNSTLLPAESQDEVIIGKPKARVTSSKRFATPPPLISQSFSDQNLWKPPFDPAAKISPFPIHEHSPIQHFFPKMSDSPTPKEAKKFWEFKTLQSSSQDKIFQVDWPTLESDGDNERGAPNVFVTAANNAVRSSKSTTLHGHQPMAITANDSHWHGKLSSGQGGDPDWHADIPSWQGDTPAWQDDSNLQNDAWPDNAKGWSDDADVWPDEVKVWTDDSKVWSDDANALNVSQVFETRGPVTPIRKLRDSWPVQSSKSDLLWHAEESGLIDKLDDSREDNGLDFAGSFSRADSREENGQDFVGSISRAYEASNSPVIYKRQSVDDDSPFKPISPIVASLERQLENQTAQTKAIFVNHNANIAGHSGKFLASILALPLLDRQLSNKDQSGHEDPVLVYDEIVAKDQFSTDGVVAAKLSDRSDPPAHSDEVFRSSNIRVAAQENNPLKVFNHDDSRPTDQVQNTSGMPEEHSHRVDDQVSEGLFAANGKIFRRRILSERRRWVAATINTTLKVTSDDKSLTARSANASTKRETPETSSRFSPHALANNNLNSVKETVRSSETVVEQGDTAAEPSKTSENVFLGTRPSQQHDFYKDETISSDKQQRPNERRFKRAIPSPLKLRSKPEPVTKILTGSPNSNSPASTGFRQVPYLNTAPITAQSALPTTSPLRETRFAAESAKPLSQARSHSRKVVAPLHAPRPVNEQLHSKPTKAFPVQSTASPLRMARSSNQASSLSPGAKMNPSIDSLLISSKIGHQPLQSMPVALCSAQLSTSPLQAMSSKGTTPTQSSTSPLRISRVSPLATSSEPLTTIPPGSLVASIAPTKHRNENPSKLVIEKAIEQRQISLKASTVANQMQIKGTMRVIDQLQSKQGGRDSSPILHDLFTPETSSEILSKTAKRANASGRSAVSAVGQKARAKEDSKAPSSPLGPPKAGAVLDSFAIQNYQRRVNRSENAQEVAKAGKRKDAIQGETTSLPHKLEANEGSKSASVIGPSLVISEITTSTPKRFWASPIKSFARKDIKLNASAAPERPKSAEPKPQSTPTREAANRLSLPSSADRPSRVRRTLLKPDQRRFKPLSSGVAEISNDKGETSMSLSRKPTAIQDDSKMNGLTKQAPSNTLKPKAITEVDTNVAQKDSDNRTPVELDAVDDGASWSFDELTAGSSDVASSVDHGVIQQNKDQGKNKRQSYQETCALADSSESSKTEAKIIAPASFTSENAVVLPEPCGTDVHSQHVSRRKQLSIHVEDSSFTEKNHTNGVSEVRSGSSVLPRNVGVEPSSQTHAKTRGSMRFQQKKRHESRFKMPLSPSTKSDAGASDTNLSIFSGASSAFSGWSTLSGVSKGSQSALSSRAGKVLQGRRRQKATNQPGLTEKEKAKELNSLPAPETRTSSSSSRSPGAVNVVKDIPSAGDARPTLASLYNRTSRFIEEASHATASVFTDSGALAALTAQGIGGSAFASPRSNACTVLDVDQSSGKVGSRTNSFGSETTESSIEEAQSNSSSVPSWTSPDPRLVRNFCAVDTNKIPCKEPCDSVRRRSAVDPCEDTASNVDAFQSAYKSISLQQLAQNISDTVGANAIDLQKLAIELKHGLSGGDPVRRRNTKRKLRVPKRNENNNDEEVAIEVEYIEENSGDSYEEDSEEEEIQSSGDVGRDTPLRVDTSLSKDLLDGESEKSISPAGQPSHESGFRDIRRQQV